MKKLIFTILLLTLTIFVGVFPFCAQAECRPWNVVATICHGDKTYHYNMQNHLDCADKKVTYLGKTSRKNLYEYLQTLPLADDEIYNYLLPKFDDVLQFFAYVCQKKSDATVSFDKNGFVYTNGIDGVSINKKALFETLLSCNNGEKIPLPILVDRAVTIQQLKQSTVVRATFSTTFYNSSADRAHNVTLATQSINGTTVGVGEKFSFNQIVGKRTEEKGYKNAKVIANGTYVDGVGGGVCQVSTTLYNALLLAGIIPNARQHTLISHYVTYGFDAMVNDNGADLTFVNDTNAPLYIQGMVQNKRVTFTIYGIPNPWQIERESTAQVTPFDTVEIVDKTKYPQLVYTDQTLVITNGSDGVKTQSFLKYYQSGKLQKTILIRKNSYKKVDKVIARGYLSRPTEPTFCPLPIPNFAPSR